MNMVLWEREIYECFSGDSRRKYNYETGYRSNKETPFDRENKVSYVVTHLKLGKYVVNIY